MSSPSMTPRPIRRRSLAGPVILILFGVLFLLRNIGLNVPLFTIFARWWPLLLIIAGVVKLIEGIQAERTGEPTTRLGGGTIFLMVMLCIFGSAASAAYVHRNDINWGQVRDEMQVDDDFMHLFGNTYSYDGEAQQVVSPNTSLKIVSDRGAITVTAWDQPNIQVKWHKRLFASSQGEADKINGYTNPQFSVAGSVITLTANTQSGTGSGLATDLDIYAPKKLAAEISAHRGDVLVNSREGDVKVDLGRGDCTTEDITGTVTADVRRGNLHVDKINGPVNITGRLSDVTLNEVNGATVFNGEIFGEIRLSKLAHSLRLTTSRTNLELEKLDGEMNMDSGQLQVDHAYGPVTVTTRAKDIRFEGVTGDTKISNDVGEITLDTGDKVPLGNIEIIGRRGDIHLHLPAKAAFGINASTRHGEASSDFSALTVSNPDHGNSIISGSVGSARSQISISTDSGDVRVNSDAKSMDMGTPATPKTPATTKSSATTPTTAPEKPATPKAPKAPKATEPEAK